MTESRSASASPDANQSRKLRARSRPDAPGLLACTSLAALPDAARPLLAPTEREDVFSSAAWYRAVEQAAIAADAAPCFLVHHEGGLPMALLPMQTRRGGRGLESLTTPYASRFRPVLGTADPALIERVGKSFGRFCRRWPSVRLDGLDPGWPGFPAFLAGIRAAGLLSERFDHFGNWHEPLRGRTWQDYLRDRPGELRESIRRRSTKIFRDPQSRFEVIADAARLAGGLALYEDIYARSWKQPEPFPAFVACWMTEAAEAGLLRLGILHVGGRAAAVQLWIVAQGWASVMKLAHDETLKAYSPGTILTAEMIRTMMAQDGIDELDFGRGDDPYKRLWAGERRQRQGLLIINPRHPQGLGVLSRHLLGRLRRAIRPAQPQGSGQG